MVKINKSIDKRAPIYISGPITSRIKLGIDWKQYFREAEIELRRLGFRQIHNPVDIATGVEAACESFGRKAKYSDYIKVDIEVLLKCSTILMLNGWESSEGALLEYSVAKAAGLEVIYER